TTNQGRSRPISVRGRATMSIQLKLKSACIAALLASGIGFTAGAASAEPVRIAFGDIATVESLNFLVAIERAKARGIEVETTFFKSEDVAAQAVVGGQ